MKGSVLVAMSGGVDSSVAAAVLRDEGYEVVGVTMKMHDEPEARAARGPKAGCCTVEDADDARAVAARLGIPYYVLDLSAPFGEHVIDNFVSEYASGRTPNPCVECNRHIKFTELVARADVLGIDFVATGHYARLEGGRLMRGTDRRKDQSYVLACVPRAMIDRTLLPVGGLGKAEVRGRAEELGLRTAGKPESMEVCFLGSAGKNPFLSRRLDSTSGPIVDESGSVIGRHDGAALYTVGQRRGIGLAAGERRFVHATDVSANEVRVASTPPCAAGLHCDAATWLGEAPESSALLQVQVSAHGDAHPSRVDVVDSAGGSVHVVFDAPVPAPAPGQLAAFYDGDTVLGAATVAEWEPASTPVTHRV